MSLDWNVAGWESDILSLDGRGSQEEASSDKGEEKQRLALEGEHLCW